MSLTQQQHERLRDRWQAKWPAAGTGPRCHVCGNVKYEPKAIADLPGAGARLRVAVYACDACGWLVFVDAAAVGSSP